MFHPIDLMSIEFYRNVDAVFLDYEEQLQSKVWRAVAVFHLGADNPILPGLAHVYIRGSRMTMRMNL